MNLWVAREPAARAEAAIMSSVANWFISTKTSGPVNGQVQDSTVGCYELTRSGVRCDKYHAMGLFAAAGGEPPRFDLDPPARLYTGREVASMLLQRAPVNYRRPPSSFSDVYAPFVAYDPDETLTVIEQGRLVRGVLDKRSVGAKASGGVFHLISREYGPQRALDMIYALQQVALQFLMWRGFTVGTADLLPAPAASEQIRALVASVELEARVVTDRLLRGEIVPPIGSSVRQFYEELQINALRVPEVEILRWVLGSVRPDSNGFFRMIAVGSKGINPNLIAVSGMIGQTLINGARIPEMFAFRRTLPYFPRFSTDPAASGFVKNSYMSGMRVTEFIPQCQNGRFDLINKALSTASTGYFMRKGVMNNQSAIVDNYRRVTKDSRVVQFLYGEDGLDSRELERVAYRFALASDADVLRDAGLGDAALLGAPAEAAAARAAAEAACRRLIADRDAYRAPFLRIERASFNQSFATEVWLPVNVRRLVESVLTAAGAPQQGPPHAAGLAARIARVEDLCSRLPYALLNEIQERLRAPVPAHLRAAARLLATVTAAELAPAVLARLTDEQLEFIVDGVRARYSLSLIEYGKAVGILAAQAISEPLTQYMLDSHHRSVAAGTNKSGLVRVSEIYGARDVAEEASPAMLLPLRGEPSAAAAQVIATSLEFVTLRRFTHRLDTILEPLDALVYPPTAGDAAWIAEFARSHALVRPPGDLTNWCFRFVLDKAALVLKDVSLELIVQRLRARHPGLYVVHTPEAAPEVAIRAWLRASLFKRGGADDEERAAAVLGEVLDTTVRGIRGIMRAAPERLSRMRAEPGGALAKRESLAIATVGTNLYAALLHPAVDSTAVVSTSVGDTLRVYGIEAARAKIISETLTFMEGNTPNLRHLQLYADEMTRTGRVTNIERGGLSAREHGNVLLRMAYGAPIQVVVDATLAGARSRVYGVAAPQLLGALPQVGTLYNTTVVDEEFVSQNVKSLDSVLNDL